VSKEIQQNCRASAKEPSAGNAPTPEIIVNNLQLDQQTSAVNDADNIEISRRLGSEDDLVVKTDEM
jgi:hypothetical protein